jgi:hypothetical protein
MLQWLHENGCRLYEGTCRGAVEGGHFEVLQWLREIGCPWDEDTCTYATKGGHLVMLQWAHENLKRLLDF